MGMATVDVNKLGNVLGQILAATLDDGAKEGEEYSAYYKNPQKYLSGIKALVGADSAVHAHGPGGIFSSAGIDNVVVNAHMTPMDLDSHLAVFPTVFMNPLYPILTGFSEDTGTEPDGVCEDCLGGTMQGGNLTAAFGHICRSGDEIHIMRTIQMINRGETTPLTLLGGVLGPGGISKMPNTPSDWLEVTTRAEMVKVAILIQRKIAKMTWSGDPVNNTANGGYREFPGLDLLVGTGKVDAETGTTMPAIDSLVMDFGFTDIEDADVGGNDIVRYLSTMEWYTRHVAERVGMMPVQWVFAMRPELWFELSSIWPCRYLTDRCGTNNAADNTIVMNGESNVDLRDKMRNGMYITVNGRNYPVIPCDGMTELHGDPSKTNYDAHLASGQYSSDIFMLPLTVSGGMNVLHWEHLDYSKADPTIALTRSGNDFWTDGGRFFWNVTRQKGCFLMSAEIDLRLILRTPHLAARLDNVRYTPLKHLRSPFAESPYFMKGGIYTRTEPSWYSEWNLPQR